MNAQTTHTLELEKEKAKNKALTEALETAIVELKASYRSGTVPNYLRISRLESTLEYYTLT